jgi:glucuronoarabinoxylan endo-1,4-beta-xylanase
MKRRPFVELGLFGVAALAASCGGSARSFDAGTTVPLAVTARVDVGERHQVMQGFGGAVAFYVNTLSNHPNAPQIYQAAFADLGIQMLRIANWYQNNNDTDGSAITDTAAVVAGATAALGHPPLIEMSAWSPPGRLKSGGHVVGGTLGQAAAGGYDYDGFGQWWAASLAAHAAVGVVPDYVSIQNEPDFQNAPGATSTWQTCLLDPTENASHAGYDKALAAVAAALTAGAGAGPAPKLLGPETSGIANGKVQSYLSALADAQALDKLDGIAHHLYNGGTGSSPSAFNVNMNTLDGLGATDDKPLFMTEYGPTTPDMFNTAYLIHNAVTVEGVSAYLFWPLTWVAPRGNSLPAGLVTTEGGPPSSWKTPNGWTINDIYYGVRHFSKWIDVGWQRVGATTTADVVVKASAFVSPDGQSLTIVLLNADSTAHDVAIDMGGFAFTTSAVYRTSGTDERTAAIGPLPDGGQVMMPPTSIATVTLGP